MAVTAVPGRGLSEDGRIVLGGEALLLQTWSSSSPADIWMSQSNTTPVIPDPMPDLGTYAQPTATTGAPMSEIVAPGTRL